MRSSSFSTSSLEEYSMILVCIGLQPTVISEYVVAMGYGHDSGLWEQVQGQSRSLAAPKFGRIGNRQYVRALITTFQSDSNVCSNVWKSFYKKVQLYKINCAKYTYNHGSHLSWLPPLPHALRQPRSLPPCWRAAAKRNANAWKPPWGQSNLGWFDTWRNRRYPTWIHGTRSIYHTFTIKIHETFCMLYT